MNLSNWKGVPHSERAPIEGRYVRLEPLDPARHGDASGQQIDKLTFEKGDA